jgi:hypothetical protein
MAQYVERATGRKNDPGQILSLVELRIESRAFWEAKDSALLLVEIGEGSYRGRRKVNRKRIAVLRL